MRLLLVEGDDTLAKTVLESMHRAGFSIDWKQDGLTATQALARMQEPYDVVLLAIGAPGLDGIEVLNTYRSAGGLAPVIILSASDAVADRIRGLDAGADGCFTEPFDSGELAARVRALRRSRAGYTQPVYIHGALTLDPTRYEASKGGKPLVLTRRQFALLLVLIEEPGRVFTRAELERKLYGRRDNVRSNAIEVHVHSLRRKIGGGEILTIRGIGYRLKML